MNGPGEPARCAGWYGKLPSLGDFASRRLDESFIQPWDAWLQRSIAASRARLGESWLQIYLTSPMWRFALAPGVCGEHAWAGLLVPSVDKVGRYFPLTFALGIARSHSLSQVFEADAWFGELEAIALAALNVDFGADRLERELLDNPLPALAESDTASGAGAVVDWLLAPQQGPVSVAGVTSLPDAMKAAPRTLFDTCVEGRTFWWSRADVTTGTELHCSAGLPPGEYYTVLLGGAQHPEPVPVDPLQAL